MDLSILECIEEKLLIELRVNRRLSLHYDCIVFCIFDSFYMLSTVSMNPTFF